MELFNAIGDFISSLSPLLVGCLSVYVAKVNSNNKKIQKIQKEKDELIEKNRKDEISIIVERVRAVEIDTEGLKTECNSFKTDLNNIVEANHNFTEKLDKIITLNEITMEYSRSISSVMIAIGGGLADRPAISEAIDKHRRDESVIISKIMKTSYGQQSL